MKVPFSLLFVGWWTAEQRWMVRGNTGQHYSKPSISVSPEDVTLGGEVRVHCGEADHPGANFSLLKSNPSLSALSHQKTMGYEAEFIISSVKTSDAGIYQCLYCFRAGSEPMCSDKSDEAYINITDPRILKPSIKVKPKHLNAVHSNVTLECQSRGDDLNFFLRKAKTGEVAQVIAPAAAKANFRFLQVRMEDAGSYICQYHHKGTPFVWSEPSDPVELILKDPSLVQPSITVRPEGPHNVGMNVTIECKGPEIGLTFSLHRSQNLKALKVKKPKGDTATFPLNTVKLKDAGNYTCRYCHRGNRFVSSEPSDPVQVTVRGMSKKTTMTIIWASVAGGLLLVLFLLLLIFILCKKRRKCSTINERNQPLNMILEQDAGTDHDGVTYAILNHHSLKIKQPANQNRGPESCVYASVAREGSRQDQSWQDASE